MEKDEFIKHASDHGYAEPTAKVFEPNMTIDMHTHDFSAMLLITEGVFELELEGGSTHYRPGEWCELQAGTRHAEKTGAAGAKGFAARKESA